MPDPSRPLLNHCAIYAQNLDRSIEFYEKAFGLTVKVRWKDLVLVTDGAERRVPLPGVHLEDRAGRRIEVFEDADSTGSQEDQKPINHFAFEVDDMPSAFQRALAAGAAPVTRPSSVTADTLRAEIAFVRGPDGEQIELLRFV